MLITEARAAKQQQDVLVQHCIAAAEGTFPRNVLRHSLQVSPLEYVMLKPVPEPPE
jgi:hypothetical protein